MSFVATTAAVAVSLGALGHMAATDPKRRRAFRLPPVARRRAGLAWALALLPGALLPAASGAGGFFVWLGAVAVGGWAIAATPPDRIVSPQAVAGAAERLRARMTPLTATAGRALQAARTLRPGAAPDRIAQLERRVRELEAEVAATRRAARADQGDNVVELARPASRC